MELSPRTAPAEGSVIPKRRRSPWAYGVLAVVLVGLGVVVYQGLTSASLYFYNADEAVEQKAELGDDRFRLQGTVRAGSIEPIAGGVAFTVAFNGVEVDVRHDGDPPELFQPGIPVVLDGRWTSGVDSDRFSSDRMVVKHSEQYQEDNGERLSDAGDGQRIDDSADATTP